MWWLRSSDLNTPNISKEIIPGVAHAVEKVCMKILVLHLFRIIVGESEDLKEMGSVP